MRARVPFHVEYSIGYSWGLKLYKNYVRLISELVCISAPVVNMCLFYFLMSPWILLFLKQFLISVKLFIVVRIENIVSFFIILFSFSWLPCVVSDMILNHSNEVSRELNKIYF